MTICFVAVVAVGREVKGRGKVDEVKSVGDGEAYDFPEFT